MKQPIPRNKTIRKVHHLTINTDKFTSIIQLIIANSTKIRKKRKKKNERNNTHNKQ